MMKLSGVRQRGGAAASIFGLVFLLVGLGIGVYFAKGLADRAATHDWVAVEAGLLRVDLESQHDSDGAATSRVVADYEYEWRGERVVSGRIDLHSGAGNAGDYQRDLYRRLSRAHRVGEPVTAWVDPGDPSNAVLERGMRWRRLAFGMIFGLVLVGAGLGIMSASRRAGPGQKQIANRKERHPDEPWMWFDRWRTPRIGSQQGAPLWMALGFAVLWNLVSLPLALVVPGEVAEGNRTALIGLVFPLIGVGLIVWAVREAVRHQRYGDSVLELDAHPVPLGGRLHAVLTVPARLDARELQLRLACVQRYTSGTGRNRSTRERELWHDEQRAMTRSGAGPGQTSARVEFDMPVDQPISSEENPRNRTIWRLTATADEPGVDYKAVFELPVFETGSARTPDARR